MRAGKRFILFLIPLLGLLLAGCEPTGQTFNIVDRLALANGVLYARVSEDCSFGKGCYLYLTIPDKVYASRDLGQTWAEEPNAPASVLRELNAAPAFPKTACRPNHPQTCYLLTGKAQVEESQDGSHTWRTVWRAPLERVKYVQRVTPLVTVSPSMTPTDLVVYDTGNDYMVFAAMGNQGLLMRSAAGEWVRAPLAGARPLPYQAAQPLEAIRAVMIELIAALVLILFATPFFVILHVMFPRLNAAWWTPIPMVLVAWACFLLWAFGVIPFYEIALAAAIALDLAILLWQIARSWRPRPAAEIPPAMPESMAELAADQPATDPADQPAADPKAHPAD